METSVKTSIPSSTRSACLIVGIFSRRKLSPAAEELDQASNGYIREVLKQGDMDGKTAQTLMLLNVKGITAKRVLLVGCGKESELTLRQYKKILPAAIKAIKATGAADATCYLTDLSVKDCESPRIFKQSCELVHRQDYHYKTTKTEHKEKTTLKKFMFNAENSRSLPKAKLAIKIANAVAAGVVVARELGNLPGNICTPAYLASTAQKNAQGSAKTKVKVLKQKEIEALKMGSFLSVAKGSRAAPRFIIIEYNGAKKSEKPYVLVGKGITFDSGGISIKPSAAMDEMKFDMCGAASVLGTMVTVSELKLPINVVALVPTCENLPDGNANKPGDVVTSMSGQTIEILNTDAEGRLVLCDALTYSERYNPKSVIDVATLTGACVVALGKHTCGLLGNDDRLISQLTHAGETSNDRAWQLPLWDEYQHQLKSNFADIANVGGRDAGTITAACFLSRFTKKLKWAHLDIAGVAWNSGAKKGATGRPVALLSQYLLDQCGKAFKI